MKKHKLLEELRQIEEEITALEVRKKEIKKQLRLIEQKENLKVSLTPSRGKYYLGKARIGKKVISVYLGRINDYKNEQIPLRKLNHCFKRKLLNLSLDNIVLKLNHHYIQLRKR